MLVVMKSEANDSHIEGVCSTIREMGYAAHPIPGVGRVAIGVTGNQGPVGAERLRELPGVADVIIVTEAHKLTSREVQPDDTVVRCGDTAVGGKEFVVMAGPCSVESPEQTIDTAKCVQAAGASVLRGGAFKPRTSPYSFQGMGEEGLKILAEARSQTGLPVISEAVDTESFDLVERYVDMIQIGSRNMQNYALLRRAGRSHKPVMLKRWMSGTLKEFLLAAEYIVSEGNSNVILCERGIRAFSNYSRFTLDISVVPELKKRTHLPVIVDPSHAAGKRHLVIPLAMSAAGVGADGVIVEVHPNPEVAKSDGPQALTFDMFGEMMRKLQRLMPALDREFKAVPC